MSGRRRTLIRLLVSAVIAVVLVGAVGCTPPPSALTKAELDAAVIPEKHPKMTAEQLRAGCRSCHKEQPPIRK